MQFRIIPLVTGWEARQQNWGVTVQWLGLAPKDHCSFQSPSAALAYETSHGLFRLFRPEIKVPSRNCTWGAASPCAGQSICLCWRSKPRPLVRHPQGWWWWGRCTMWEKLVWNQGITKNKETSWSYPSIWFSSCWPYHNLLLWRQPSSICQSYPPVQLPRMMRFSSFVCMFLKLLYSLVLCLSFVTLSLSVTLILSCPISSQINRSTLGELSTLRSQGGDFRV